MIKLINDDCLKVMKDIPDNSIDLIVTDPPYKKKSNGYKAGGGAFGSTNRKYHCELDNNNLLKGLDNELLKEFLRVMKKCNIYIFCNKSQIRQYLDFFEAQGYNMELLTWHKTNPVPTCNNKYLSDTEYILFFRENEVKIYGTYMTKKKWYVTATNKADKKKYQHPTIKPLNIIENLLTNSSKKNQIVLDPFMGSGTTGVACKELGRDFIGIEIDKNYFEIAKERIENTVKEIEND